MPLNDSVSEALRVLKEVAAKEKDRSKLVQLVEEMQLLLDVIETRLTGLEADRDSSSPSD